MTLKYSRQREAIKENMINRKDHPTADMVYNDIRKSFPNISLGTVYRNLQLLTEIGELQRIKVGDGLDHFDADISRHYHFFCNNCGAVLDVEFDDLKIDNINPQNFDGRITDYSLLFTGECGNCK